MSLAVNKIHAILRSGMWHCIVSNDCICTWVTKLACSFECNLLFDVLSKKNIDINTFIDKLNNNNDDVTSRNLDTKVYRCFHDCSHTI